MQATDSGSCATRRLGILFKDMTTQPTSILSRAAIFEEPSREFRYTLVRECNLLGKGVLMVIGLNPSTADEQADDPTIRRCKGFCETLGFRTYLMCNLFAFRSTDPRRMLQHPAPVGPQNDAFLTAAAAEARDSGGMILAAWGTHGTHRGRDHYVRSLLTARRHRLMCLGYNTDGTPKHPLYINRHTSPQPYLP